MNHFYEGFEKQALSVKPLKTVLEKVKKFKAPSTPAVKPTPPTKTDVGVLEKIREWANRNRNKARVGMAVTALPAALYVGHKAIDKAIGTPKIENEW